LRNAEAEIEAVEENVIRKLKKNLENTQESIENIQEEIQETQKKSRWKYWFKNKK
jgi:gas vesicle protein